jgi:hypothetical protein
MPTTISGTAKARISRIRRLAAKRDWRLRMSCTRDPAACDYRAAWITDEYGHVIAGDALRGPANWDLIEAAVTAG